MKLRRGLWLAISLALVLTLGFGCASTQKTAETSRTEATPQWYFGDIVNADFVAQYAKLPPPPNVWIVDVRPKQEYDDGHIFASFSIPANQPGELPRLLPKNKSTVLIFYCDAPTCELSHKSARDAQELGYQNVKVFAGGISEWEKNYELVALGKKAIAEGFGVVDYGYVKGKVGKGIHQFDNVVIIDARPERMYSAGHIPSAISLPSMKFAKDYPEFEKLNIARNAEIILGVGRECPLSFKNAMRLKEKGYTNLNLYIAPPIWLGTDYVEIDSKRAKKLHDEGVLFVDARPERLFKKGTIEGAVNVPVTKFEEYNNLIPQDKTKPVVSFCQGYKCAKSHELANKMRDLGYSKVVVYAGGYPEWEKIFTSTVVKVKTGSEEGTIDIASFEKILKENPNSVYMFDVRSAAEFSTGAFNSAMNLTVDDLEEKVKKLPTDKPIIFVCSTGARSGEAYYMVQDLRPELKEVYFLDAEVSYNKDGSYKITAPM